MRFGDDPTRASLLSGEIDEEGVGLDWLEDEELEPDFSEQTDELRLDGLSNLELEVLTSPLLADNPDLREVSAGRLLVAKRGTRSAKPVISNGLSVLLVQKALLDLGYELPRFGADGNFGSETETVVRRYQADRGLKPDGVVGPRTLLRLDLDIAAGKPTPGVPQLESPTATYWRGILKIGLEGNTVTPLVDGKATFEAIQHAIETTSNQTHFVYLLGWWCDPWVNLTGAGTSLLDLFAHLGASGVQARGLLWEPSSLVYPNHARLHDAAIDAINRIPGCHFQQDDPPESTKSHHQKAIVVRGNEGLIALVGGVDVNADRRHALPPPSNAYRSDRPDNVGWVGGSGGSGSGSGAGGGGEPLHDVHSLLTGPTALPILRAFLRRWWARSGDRAIDSTAPLRGSYSDPIPPVTGSQFVRIGETFNGELRHPGGRVHSRRVDAQDIWLRSILGARRFIYMEEQYLTHPCAAEALNSVLPRLDHVIILIPPSEITDLPGRWQRRRAFLGRVVTGPHASKVRVYTRAVDAVDTCRRTGGRHLYIHSKAAVIDDELAIIGSANCNHRGWETDSELVIATFDETDLAIPTAKNLRMRLWSEHLGVTPSAVEDAPSSKGLWDTASTRQVCRYDPNGGTDSRLDWTKPDSIVDPEDMRSGDPCRTLI